MGPLVTVYYMWRTKPAQCFLQKDMSGGAGGAICGGVSLYPLGKWVYQMLPLLLCGSGPIKSIFTLCHGPLTG